MAFFIFGRPMRGNIRMKWCNSRPRIIAGAPMLSTFLTAIDWFGVAIFAVTGALVASRKRMDITGFILLGCVTGMGGGSLRDAVLGALPVFWVREPVYLVICVIVSAATFFLAHIPESRYRVLLWLDAAALASVSRGGA